MKNQAYRNAMKKLLSDMQALIDRDEKEPAKEAKQAPESKKEPEPEKSVKEEASEASKEFAEFLKPKKREMKPRVSKTYFAEQKKQKPQPQPHPNQGGVGKGWRK